MILDSNPNFALYYPPDNYLRSKVFYFVSNKYFDAMIILIIIANVVVLSLSYDGNKILIFRGFIHLQFKS